MNIKKYDVFYFILCIVLFFLISLIKCGVVKENENKIRKVGYPQKIIEIDGEKLMIIKFHDYVLDTIYNDTILVAPQPI